MSRRIVTVLVAAVALTAAGGACSTSSDDEKSTSTTISSEAETTSGGRIDLGDLAEGGGTAGEITAADEECINDGAADDPLLADATSYDDLVTTAQKEAFWDIAIDCVGSAVLIDLFMQGFTEEAPQLTSAQIDCARTEVGALSRDEAVALLSEDPTVTDQLTTDIALNCLA